MFKFIETPLSGLIIIQAEVFIDDRGYFMESYMKSDFESAGILSDFVQDNQSISQAGVLRGLHFQTQHTQSKLVRVIAGSIYDVVVDLRKDSSTYGKWYSIILSATNKKQLFIPKGFAHGYLTLEDNTEFLYKCDEYYAPEYDGGIAYNSPELDIDWEEYFSGDFIISERDKNHPNLSTFQKNNPF